MDVIVLSEIKWGYMRTRKHYLLERFPLDWRIFFFEPVTKGRKNSIFPRKSGNVTFVTVPVLKSGTRSKLYNLFVESNLVRMTISYLTLLTVKFWTAFLRVRRPAFVFVSNPLFLPVARSLKAFPVFYDCNDDPIHFPSAREWVKGYFAQLLRLSDIVFACSSGLMSLVKEMGVKNPVMVGNGVDLTLFRTDVKLSEIPDEIAKKKKPIVGYVGTFSEWFNTQLSEKLSRSLPDCSLVIVGPVSGKMKERAKKLEESLPNVYFLGEKEAKELPLYLEAMDVCLIPFQKNEFTASLNPNKVYEYMASGKTVVSLDYSEDIKMLKDFIYIAREENEFVELVKKALSSPKDPGILRRKAEANTWDKKADDMLHAIREYFLKAGTPV